MSPPATLALPRPSQEPRWEQQHLQPCPWHPGIPGGMQGPQKDEGTSKRMQGPLWDAGILSECRTRSGSRGPGRAAPGPSVLCGSGFLWLPCPCPPIPAALTEFQENSALTQGPVQVTWSWHGQPDPLPPHKDVKNLLSCTPLPVVPSRGGGSGARIAPVPLPELQQEVAPQPAWPGAVGSPFPKGGLVENMLMGLLQPSPGVCGSSCFNCRILYIFKGELL